MGGGYNWSMRNARRRNKVMGCEGEAEICICLNGVATWLGQRRKRGHKNSRELLIPDLILREGKGAEYAKRAGILDLDHDGFS